MHAANHTSSMLTLINPAVVHNRTKSYPPSHLKHPVAIVCFCRFAQDRRLPHRP